MCFQSTVKHYLSFGKLGVMDRVKKVLSVLEDAGCDFWIDSGTLLGAVREGDLIPSDHDIDISILHNSALDVWALRRMFLAKGYTVQVLSYEGQVFKLVLHRRDVDDLGDRRYRVVDLRVFYLNHQGDYVRSTQIDRAEFHGVQGEITFRRYFYSARSRAASVLQMIFPRVGIDNFVMRALRPIIAVGCWQIPVSFVRETTDLGDGLRAPLDYEGYLGYRYGDWRTPNPDWNFRLDDPTLIYLPVHRAVSMPE